MHVQTYLFFNGRCEEALEFYRAALGAEIIALSRFKEAPDQSMLAPGTGEKVMHGSFRGGEPRGRVPAGGGGGQPSFDVFSLPLPARDEAEAERLFAALSEGEKVEMPRAETFFARRFGSA